MKLAALGDGDRQALSDTKVNVNDNAGRQATVTHD